MISLIQLMCWFIVELALVFYHVVILMRLLGPDAFMKNSPQELADKILLIICSCALSSGIVGLGFFKLCTI